MTIWTENPHIHNLRCKALHLQIILVSLLKIFTFTSVEIFFNVRNHEKKKIQLEEEIGLISKKLLLKMNNAFCFTDLVYKLF